MLMKQISADRYRVKRNSTLGWLATIRAWAERRRQRQALANLDQHLLDDIGISRAAAAHEIAKPFWR